tara:strand:- start:110770 stop:111513 length:744 start_codon:yes stop_codon:yes gene_type:complete
MTSKDLHLTLDERLTRSGAAHEEQPGPAESVLPSMRPERFGDAPAAVARPTAQGAGASALWIVTLLLGAANIAVLCAGGYWLYSQNLLQPAVESQSADRLQLQVGELQAQVSELGAAVLALDERLQQLQVASADERQQINRALLDLRVPSAPAATVDAAAPPPAAAPVLPQWQVTVQTFASQDAATALSERLAEMSYAAKVLPVDVDGEAAFRVLLVGFSSREQAEEAAGDLMGKLDINGLWVWKAD